MKLSYRYQFIFTIAIVSLLAGTVNYLLFRPDIMLFKITGISVSSFNIKNDSILHFLTGYFSDMAWCIALCCIAFAFAELNYISFSGKISLLLLPFITEALQYFRIINGIFDWFDVLTYTLIIAIFVLLFPTLKKTFVYEKD